VHSKNLLIPLYSKELCAGTQGPPLAKNVAQGSNSTGDVVKVRTEDHGSVANQQKKSEKQDKRQEEEEGQGLGEDDGVYAEISAVKQMLTQQQKLCGGIRIIFLVICIVQSGFMLSCGVV
jgi:hypothetical protein